MDDFELCRKDHDPYPLFNSTVSQPPLLFLLTAPLRNLFRLFSDFPFLKFKFQRYAVCLFVCCTYIHLCLRRALLFATVYFLHKRVIFIHIQEPVLSPLGTTITPIENA